MYKLQKLSIAWNYDTDNNMTVATSSDKVLEIFFSMKNWDFVRYGFSDIWEERDFEYEEKRVEFNTQDVFLYSEETKTSLDKQEYLRVMAHLYDLMIIGANEDHHNVRYETWWQEFTEVNYKMKCKIEMHDSIQGGDI